VASYAVIWREEGGLSYAGRLELGSSELRLLGSGPRSTLARVRVPYGDVVAVRIGRSPAERLDGARSVILERRAGAPVMIGAVSGVGVVFELAEVLADLATQGADAMRIAVVVPINGCARARELIEAGPPFEISDLPIDRHQVFLTEREAIFVFEGKDVSRTLETLARRPQVWTSAAAWKDCIAGRPRVAELAYAWARR
jgi:hypothetical protein